MGSTRKTTQKLIHTRKKTYQLSLSKLPNMATTQKLISRSMSIIRNSGFGRGLLNTAKINQAYEETIQKNSQYLRDCEIYSGTVSKIETGARRSEISTNHSGACHPNEGGEIRYVRPDRQRYTHGEGFYLQLLRKVNYVIFALEKKHHPHKFISLFWNFVHF